MSHARRSIRLKDYDYTKSGVYFVTMCVHGGKSLFGTIVNSEVVQNECGDALTREWLRTEDIRHNVHLDEYIVMPDHFHAIVYIDNHDICRGTACRAHMYEQFSMPVLGPLSTVVRSFKSAVTRQINVIRNTPGDVVWQRNYYERIIRSDRELCDKRAYIHNNVIHHMQENMHVIN